MNSIQNKVEEVEIPQKHIEALERINAITVMDRLSYNVHKQSKNAEEVCGILSACQRSYVLYVFQNIACDTWTFNICTCISLTTWIARNHIDVWVGSLFRAAFTRHLIMLSCPGSEYLDFQRPQPKEQRGCQ